MELIRDVFTPDQAAAYLQVNRETIYRYIRDGRLVAARLGRAYRIPRQSIEHLLWSNHSRNDVALGDFSDAELHDAHAVVERTAGIFRHAAKHPSATIAEETDAFEQGVANEVMHGAGG